LFALRAAAYAAFNAPNLDNLYRAYATPGFIGLPNAQLDPERARGVEAGLDITDAKTRAQVTLFTSTIRNAITARNLDPSEPIFPPGYEFGTLNINAGKLRSRGVEVEVTRALSRAWHVDGAYTFADAAVIESPLDPSALGHQTEGVPRHAANVGVGYEPVRGFGAEARLRWTSAYTALFSRNPLGRAAVLDASARYVVGARLTVYARVANMLDRDYLADDNGFLPPQRGQPFNIFVGVRVTSR
jgi:iron complex outermembrane receptor protein